MGAVVPHQTGFWKLEETRERVRKVFVQSEERWGGLEWVWELVNAPHQVLHTSFRMGLAYTKIWDGWNFRDRLGWWLKLDLAWKPILLADSLKVHILKRAMKVCGQKWWGLWNPAGVWSLHSCPYGRTKARNGTEREREVAEASQSVLPSENQSTKIQLPQKPLESTGEVNTWLDPGRTQFQ